MDYEKHLKEALSDVNTPYVITAWIEENFPELTESEDERIRKALLNAMSDYTPDSIVCDGIRADKIIAWLEKQCKCETDFHHNHQDANYPNGGIVLEDFNDGEGFYKLNLDHLNKKQVEEIEEMVRMWNKEPKASNDNIKSCIGMCLTDVDEQRFKEYNTSLKDCLNWLEKQGNDSYLQEKIENFTNAHKGEDPEGIIAACRGGEKQGANSVTITKGNNSITNAEVVSHPTVIDSDGGKCTTASITIEPKFHEGDWVAYNSQNAVSPICQITKVDGDIIDLKGLQGERFQTGYWDLNENYHLWTIQDAKDGDVLACEDGRPFIFRGCVDPHHPNCPVAYCGIDSENLFLNDDLGTCWWTDENVHPATKEQRDLLFSKMNKAGYEWDAEKKELIKVELTEWTPKEGDVVRLKEDNGQRWTISLSAEPDTYEKWFLSLNTKDGVAGGYVSDYLLKENYTFVNNPLEEAKKACKEEVAKLGKALAEAVKPTEWSKEDTDFKTKSVRYLCNLRDTFEESKWDTKPIQRCINWLLEFPKPQFYWKPSKEQMKALYDSIPEKVMEISEREMLLNELYKDLMKLPNAPKQEVNEEEIIAKHITNGSLSDVVNDRLNKCGWYVTDSKAWKPSKEQMEALNKVMEMPLHTELYLRLSELYNDLS